MNELIPCFGVMCERHKECARYHAIEISNSKLRFGHCPRDAEGNRTKFVPMFVTPARGERHRPSTHL